jgi:hypothetical protein
MKMKLQGLRPDTTYKVQVRARSADGRVSEFSPTANMVIPSDTNAPNKPSTPTLTAKLGTVSVRWDGKDSAGASMAEDFHYVDVHTSSSAGFMPGSNTIVGKLFGPDVAVVSNLAYIVHYFKLVAYDLSGNPSTASDEASIQVVGLVSDDVTGEINGANIQDGSIVAAEKIVAESIYAEQIHANAIETDKLAANSIVADKIDAGAITAEKLSFGTVSSNLIKNPGFEEIMTDLGQPSIDPILLSNVYGWPGYTSLTGGTGYSLFDEGNSGRRGARLSTAANQANSGVQIESNIFPIESGQSYAISHWFRSSYAVGSNTDMSLTMTIVTSATTDFTTTWTPSSTPIDLLVEGLTYQSNISENVTISEPGQLYGKLRIKLIKLTADATQQHVDLDGVSVIRMGFGASALTATGLKLWGPEGAERVSLSGSDTDALRIGGGLASIESSGNINGIEATFDSLSVGGKTIQELSGDGPKGIIAFGRRIEGATTYTTGFQPFVEIQADLEADRLYKIATSNFFFQVDAAPATAIGYLLYTTDGTDPWANGVYSASRVLTLGRIYLPGTTNSQGTLTTMLSRLYSTTDAVFIRVVMASLAQLTISGATTTVAVRSETHHPFELYIQDMGPSSVKDVGIERAASTPSSVVKKTYTKKYYATWSRSFEGNNSTRYNDPAYLYHGYYSSNNGNQKSMIGFPYSTIVSDLTGATLKSCTLTLKNLHTGTSSGMTELDIGYHAQASKPSTFSGTTNRYNYTITPGSTKSFDIKTYIAPYLQSGAARGITLGPPSSTSLANYGYFAGYGMTGVPYLTISYVK